MEPVMGNPSSAFSIAVVGGGITGACVASVLRSVSSIYQNSPALLEPTSKLCKDRQWRGIDITIELFDQGKSGLGGRSSHRKRTPKGIDGTLRWDHGCQFFRADTELFHPVLTNWLENGIAKEWKGRFTSDDETTSELDFFGLPSQPPFYVGVDGINTIPTQLLGDSTDILKVFSGTRVSRMERDESTKKWHLFGTSGQAAFHDTPEEIAQASSEVPLGQQAYDAVMLTDVSSSFGTWHRASAGVPEDFATRVRDLVGARVPLFAVMIAFNEPLSVEMDAMSFHKNEVLWFAARSTSKPLSSSIAKDCWTLISTPEYAMDKIEETPMQDPKTGAFLPQNKDYLTTIPGPDLESAFRKAIISKYGPIELPATVYLDAQRWGSALPSHRHLDDSSSTRRIISGVPYDYHTSPLAPTKLEAKDTELDFLFDHSLMLYQAGDMMSRYTPGYEGAAISGIQAAEHLLNTFLCRK